MATYPVYAKTLPVANCEATYGVNICRTLASIDAKFVSIDGLITKIQAAIDILESQLETLEANLQKREDEYKTLQTDLANATGPEAAAKIKVQLDAKDAQIATLEKQVTQKDADITKWKQTLESVNDPLKTVLSNLDTTEQRLGGIGAKKRKFDAPIYNAGPVPPSFRVEPSNQAPVSRPPVTTIPLQPARQALTPAELEEWKQRILDVMDTVIAGTPPSDVNTQTLDIVKANPQWLYLLSGAGDYLRSNNANLNNLVDSPQFWKDMNTEIIQTINRAESEEQNARRLRAILDKDRDNIPLSVEDKLFVRSLSTDQIERITGVNVGRRGLGFVRGSLTSKTNREQLRTAWDTALEENAAEAEARALTGMEGVQSTE